jgi:thiamine-monophosphate kinase
VIAAGSTVGQIGERALVAHLRSRIPQGPGVVTGVGDDAAVVELAGLALVTTDAMVEGVHFNRDWSPGRLLGRKALSVNLSDVAAMGGIPRFATVSLALPHTVPIEFIDLLYDGLLERGAETGVHIVGGNVARTEGPISIHVTVIGQAERVLLRSGAQPGDMIVVTGRLGGAACGLRLLAQGARLSGDGLLESTGVWTESSGPSLLACLRAQLDPSPPLAFARSLTQHDVVHAAMDLSDGLSGDLLHMCTESDLAARVDPGLLPIDACVLNLERARGGDPRPLALHGGEDYEMLLAVAPDRLDALRDLAVIWDLPISVVGEFVPGAPGITLETAAGLVECPQSAHDHFKAAPTRRDPDQTLV